MPRQETTYAGAELARRLAALPGWAERDGAIERTYKTDGWPTTLMLVNAVGFIAEAADHHPDLSVSWGQLIVRLNTHSAGGITDKDLELARAIESQALWRPSGGSLTATAKKWVSPASSTP
jgi:4a-hydroxytetrahydrobiopterin dehydratase